MNNQIVQDFFNQVADTYTHDDLSKAYEILSSLPLQNRGLVLDIGCGKGAISSKLAELSNGKVIGIDISSKMIDYANRDNSNPNVSFICEDFYKYNGQPVDAIIAFDCYPHFLDGESFVKQAFSLLKSGGLLAIFHDIGRPVLNEHHKKTAGSVSRLLKTPQEEAEPYLKEFDPLILEESDNCYKLILIKR